MKIGAHTYTIKRVNGDHFDDCGKVDKEKKIIYINENLTGTEYTATLIHECLHVINDELPHETIEFLAQAFTQLITDNNMYTKHKGNKKPRKKKGK